MLDFEQGAGFELIATIVSTSAETIDITGATKAGPFRFSIQTDGTGANQIVRMRMSDLPLWVTAIDQVRQIRKGRVYIHLALAINNDQLYSLLSGYVYSARALAWPAANLNEPDMIDGEVKAVNGTNPAAGSEISYTVPAYYTLELLSITFSLVTSATVASRSVHLNIQVSGATVYQGILNTSQAASTTRTYFFQAGHSLFTDFDNTTILGPLPAKIIIPPGDIITTTTTNLQAGDDFGLPVINGIWRLRPQLG